MTISRRGINLSRERCCQRNMVLFWKIQVCYTWVPKSLIRIQSLTCALDVDVELQKA